MPVELHLYVRGRRIPLVVLLVLVLVLFLGAASFIPHHTLVARRE